MLRSSLLVVCCFVLLAVPASARALPPQCEDQALLTPVDAPLNLPAPKCTGLSQQTALEVVPGSGPAHGTINSGVYVPFSRYHGEDAFRYVVTDAVNGKSNAYTVDVLVDTPPVCRDMTLSTTVNQALTLPAPDCTDKDGDSLIVGIAKPTNGVFGTVGRNLVYTPNPGFTGDEAVPFFAREATFDDWDVDSEDAVMRISVKPIVVIPRATPTPTPVPTPVPDTTAPAITLKNASKKQAVAITLTRDEIVTAKLTLTLDKATAKKLKLASRTVGTLSSALTPGTSTLKVKWTAKATKALKKVKSVKVTVTAFVTDAAGNSSTKSLVLTLKK